MIWRTLSRAIPLRHKVQLLLWIAADYDLRIVAPYSSDPQLRLLAPNDGVLVSLLRGKCYHEETELDFVCRLIDCSSNMIDIGANVGFWTLVLAQTVRNGTGRVYAFEPTPETFRDLRANLSLNGLGEDSVKTLSSALGDAIGASALHCYRTNGSSGWNTLGNPWVMDRGIGALVPTDCITVDVITVDDWWRKAGRPQCDFVKIDVEGYEPRVLSGARDFIEAHIGNRRFLMMLEVNPQALASAGSSVAALWEQIAHLGFEVGLLYASSGKPPVLRALGKEEFSGLTWANCFLCHSIDETNARSLLPSHKYGSVVASESARGTNC